MRLSAWLNASRAAATRARRRPLSQLAHSEALEQRLLLTSPPVSSEIFGTVFSDVDSNGEQGPDEPGLAGWTVYADLNQNAVFDQTLETTVVAATGLPIGIYDQQTSTSIITVPELAGTISRLRVHLNLTHTYDRDLVITLTGRDGTVVTLARNVGGAADHLTNTIFDDAAVLGIQDEIASAPFTGSYRPTEPLARLLGGTAAGEWTLKIEDTAQGDGGQLLSWSLEIETTTPTEPYSITDVDGAYALPYLPDGTYDIRQVPRFGWEPTAPEAGRYTVVIPNDQMPAPLLFGNDSMGAVVAGRQWNDLDGDGMWDTSEPALNGWSIELLDAVTQQVVAQQYTVNYDLNHDETIDPLTESGWYRFEHLPAGTYLVRATQPNGWRQTAPVVVSEPGGEPVVYQPTYSTAAPPTGTKASPVPWYPDLTVDVTSGLLNWYITGNTIRFAQSTPNVGHGPMRIYGGPDQGDGTQLVYQRVYNDQGGYIDYEAGYFEYHPEHNHLHFNGYAVYNLRSVLPDADSDGIPEAGDIVRSGEKTSFCLVDIMQFDPTLPNAAPDVSGCGCEDVQQISVGWADIYGAETEGQEISIAGLPPGQYWLEAVVDPDNHLRETDDTNNTGRVLVTIGAVAGSHQVTVVAEQIISDRNFGSFQQVEVQGRVYRDDNENGQQDGPAEAGLSGRAVFLDLNGDGVLNNPDFGDNIANPFAIEPWAITDKNGDYRLLENSPYTAVQIRLIEQPGEELTTADFPPLTLRSGDVAGPLHFGVLLNSVPVVQLLAASPQWYYPGSAPQTVWDVAEVTDPDGTSFGGGSLLISVLNVAEGDVLEVSDITHDVGPHGHRARRHTRHDEVTFKIANGQIFVNGQKIGQIVAQSGLNGAPLLVTLNHNATAESVEEVLRHVRYSSSSADPVVGTRRIQCVVSDARGGISEPVVTELMVLSRRNNPPLLNLLDAPAIHTGGSQGVAFGIGATITDPEYSLLRARLTIAITQNRQRGDHLQLSFAEHHPYQLRKGKITQDGVLLAKVQTRRKGGELRIQFAKNSTIDQVSEVLRQTQFYGPPSGSPVPNRVIQVELQEGARGEAARDTREIETIPLTPVLYP